MNRWIAIVLVAACSKGAATDKPATGKKGGKLEYPVDVAPFALRQMQYTVTAPGSIDAFQQVQITARVAGAVDKVGFAEGQQVQAAIEGPRGARCSRQAPPGRARG